MSNEKIDDDLFEDAVAEDAAGQIDLEVSEDANVHQELLDQLKEAEGKSIRAIAELENYRNRARRELGESLKYANQGLLTDMLPVIDNVYRAISAASQHEATGGLLEGVLLVAKEILSVLDRHDCRRIDAIGEVFDPNLHEAIQQMSSPDIEAGRVMQVVQEGYVLHDRIIRPANVIVSTGPAAE